MTTESATQTWYAMTAMQRYEVMQRVGYMKSMTKRQRACIALIKSEG